MNATVWESLDERLPPGARFDHSHNRLLARMPSKPRDAFIASCERVTLEHGQILSEAGEEIRFVYFPLTCYLSQVLVNMESALEVTMTGNEGMCGLPVVLGSTHSTLTTKVQGGGAALRISVPAFVRALREGEALRNVLGKYAHVSLGQAALGISCARFHSVEQRLARWLLMTADRARSPAFTMTQRMLAYVMGVRRVGVTNAAGALQGKGLVRYTRGAMRILDMPGLEKAACRCHGEDLAIYSRALGSDATSEGDDKRVAS